MNVNSWLAVYERDIPGERGDLKYAGQFARSELLGMDGVMSQSWVFD
jgi:hypothetical protein